MDIKVQFDARATLQAMEKSPQTTVDHMRMALMESCRLVQRGAREMHRFRSRTGALEQAIRQAILFRSNLNKCEGIIDIDPARAPYGNYVHTGTRPHVITPRDKMSLRFVGNNGRFVFAKKINHPGTKPDEFLYESGERNRAEINNIFARHTGQALKEAGL